MEWVWSAMCFTTNDSWQPNPTLCRALDGVLCLWLYRGEGQGGQMVEAGNQLLSLPSFSLYVEAAAGKGPLLNHDSWIMWFLCVFYPVWPSWSQYKVIKLFLSYLVMSITSHFLLLSVTVLFVCFLAAKQKRSTDNGQFRFSSPSPSLVFQSICAPHCWVRREDCTLAPFWSLLKSS